MKGGLLNNRSDVDKQSKAQNNRDSAKAKLNAMLNHSDVRMIDCEKIGEWEYANRADIEFGDIKELAESIKNNTQLQPGIVVQVSDTFRAKDNKDCDYVVIAGRRRLKACREAGVLYTANVLTNMDIEDALEIQRIENTDRVGVSDFSEGMTYYNAIKRGDTSLEKIQERSNQSKTHVFRTLYFGKIKDDYPELFNAVEDFTKVSYRSADEIYQLCQKGYKDVLINNANNIRKGIGSRKLEKIVQEAESNAFPKEWKDNNGVTLFTQTNKNTIRINHKALKKQDDKLMNLIAKTLSKQVL